MCWTVQWTAGGISACSLDGDATAGSLSLSMERKIKVNFHRTTASFQGSLCHCSDTTPVNNNTAEAVSCGWLLLWLFLLGPTRCTEVVRMRRSDESPVLSQVATHESELTDDTGLFITANKWRSKETHTKTNMQFAKQTRKNLDLVLLEFQFKLGFDQNESSLLAHCTQSQRIYDCYRFIISGSTRNNSNHQGKQIPISSKQTDARNMFTIPLSVRLNVLQNLRWGAENLVFSFQ